MSVYNDTLTNELNEIDNYSNFTNTTDIDEPHEESIISIIITPSFLIISLFTIFYPKWISNCCKSIEDCCKHIGDCRKHIGDCCKRIGDCRKHIGDCCKRIGDCCKCRRIRHNIYLETNITFDEPDHYIVVVIQKQNISTPINDECPICLETINEEDNVINLECRHQYHQPCLMPWIDNQLSKNNNSSCPLCRSDIKYQISKLSK